MTKGTHIHQPIHHSRSVKYRLDIILSLARRHLFEMILQPSDFRQRILWSSSIVNNPQTPIMDIQTGTGTELAREWANPSVAVATVLMFIGGNVIQEAFAQSTGKILTPVCFSFGWVAYALSSLKDSFGEGRLLPPADYPVKVFNLSSGYYRVNKNWLIGRIVRDHESRMSKIEPLNDCGIRISIFEATPVNQRAPLSFQYNTRHLLGAFVMLAQLAIAAIPTVRTQGQEWGILAITGFGTLLSIVMGSLPQWWAEKMPSNRSSKKVFALTVGNGSRDIIIIKGEGRCLDLEELATLGSPRAPRLWTKMDMFSVLRPNSKGRDVKLIFGRPVGFLLTRCVCVFEALGWFLILISLAGIRSHTWCLIAIGVIGWIHNVMLANLQREPKTRNLPLKLLDTISTHKVMDGLMDLEVTHEGCGEALLQEFFPGRLRPEEDEWWREKGRRSRTKYDQMRLKDCLRRLRPRSMLPKYNLHATSGTPTLELDLGNAMDQTRANLASPTRSHDGGPAVEEAMNQPTLEDIVKKSPKRPVWD
ncbi:hypothetical protein F5Y01DRAFT_272576 [Xylaria sp. FL0043]|nr:hypothetical protein F5Y01DRAFT_272576 [Xylaria sp. FL0043]